MPPLPLHVPEDEVELSAMRAQGAGGQNVNKVSSAVHLRFDIRASSLPDDVKERLLTLRDSRITQDGVIVIKAQQYRSQEQNRADALQRLDALVNTVAIPPRVRRATKPTYSSKLRRLQIKTQRSETKALRGKVRDGSWKVALWRGAARRSTGTNGAVDGTMCWLLPLLSPAGCALQWRHKCFL